MTKTYRRPNQAKLVIEGGIFKLIRSPGVDSKESIQSAYTVKRVDEVVRHPHLVTQDQFTQVSKKVSDIRYLL